MQKFIFSNKLKTALSVGIFIGVVTFFAGLLIDRERFWHSFLTSSLFVLFISLGGVFFTAVLHISRAGWHANIRRIMEGCGTYIPLGSLLSLLLLFAGSWLYPWFDSEVISKDPLLQHKSAYLNPLFFFIRLILFSGIWIFFSQKLIRLSLRQDTDKAAENFKDKFIPLSIAFVILFALSFSFFCFDVLMSLEPHWFSTVFAVYCFAGLFQSFIAALILIIIYLKRTSALSTKAVNENHLHDLGKFLLGCTVFWAYIAFSQYMLIWYANLPEEAIYYLKRSQGDWLWLSLGLIVFKFILPFLVLLPRWVKRNERAMIFISSLILIAQYADIYWMVYPQLAEGEGVRFGFMELGLMMGFVGLFLYCVFHFLSKHPLIPVQEPGKEESSAHIVTY